MYDIIKPNELIYQKCVCHDSVELPCIRKLESIIILKLLSIGLYM